MNDDQLLRYSRQMMLPEIDAAGQQRLGQAHLLVIGMGGLGAAAAMYLAAAGAGRLTIVDDDDVELSNLQRQIIYATADIGRPKVEAAAERLRAMNPEIAVTPINARLDETALTAAVADADLVVDCCDNFQTRFMINRACQQHLRPLVSAAAIRFEAQISVFDPRQPDSPCYRCLYTDEAAVAETCTANGVIAPLLGIVGSIQALEAMKLIMAIGTPLTGRLLLFDALRMEWHSARLPRDRGCPVCANRYHADHADTAAADR
ncbi:adenylyltransferase/sulfurtransferase [Methylohalomonas lacus]|uniref:Adenylyltransferase/sulfurtransferase n=1 Tax=Methylohalomonas lacus TaxID=398773 RepID=A0AAE3L3G4_9GAMM|nr:molybdopterin-synthase adenylyltransferase MoeB [Methylohalomonas lacus]MCS3902078.1 adenylyltransferase/sulfurtransferase [Methylohalomonas lacus]